ncbi:formamidopyrimidine-DNA glycosylase [soil metagenome]
MTAGSGDSIRRPVPELPDVTVLQEAFHAALAGRSLCDWSAPQSLVVRGTAAEAMGMSGKKLDEVQRRGKFLTLVLGGDRITINPMLTGRLGLAAPGTKPFGRTALVMTFGPRAKGAIAGRQGPQRPSWTRGAAWLPHDDATVELRYRDSTRMGKVYLLPAGVERPVAGWDAQGPDADDPTLDAVTWRKRITRHRGELKALLKDQTFVAGIGNGYSDEILWAAGLAPFRKRTALAEEEIETLYASTREVMRRAVDELRRRVPPRFEVEVRDFLKVHRKGGSPCPRCGTALSEISPGGFVTTWCRVCQP